MLGKKFPGLFRDEIMFVWQTESFARGIDIFRAGLVVRFVRAGDFRNAFADEGVRDDKLWSSIISLLCDIQRVEKLLHVVAIDLLDVESVRFESHAAIFALRLLRCRVECDGIGIVDEDQIIETKVTRRRA